MTNNPTIDGVSRERVEAIAREMDRLGYGHHESHAESILRALLDAKYHPCPVLLDGCDGSCAPAVERQEPAAFRFKWDYDHGNGWCRGAVRFVESMEEVDHEDKSTWREITPLYEAAPEVAALQSTIARLEARIAELESGRGEPVCYQARHSAEEPWFFTDKPGYWEWRPLFTAPPAPVAVLPDGWKLVPVEPTELMIRRGDQNYSWSVAKIYKAMLEDAPACLDATAALNGAKP